MCGLRTRYSTDLSDPEWEILCPLVPAVKPGGRPAKHTRREILNSLAYWLRAGCAWRLLPHDLPPWQTVYHYWRQRIPLDLGSGGSTASGSTPLRGGPAALGGGADVCLAGTVPLTVEGLRIPASLLGERHLPHHGHAPCAPPRKTNPLTGFSDTL
ncbi:hypothetical protein GCM10009837_67920 [Streptomyces durmitorensis]